MWLLVTCDVRYSRSFQIVRTTHSWPWGLLVIHMMLYYRITIPQVINNWSTGILLLWTSFSSTDTAPPIPDQLYFKEYYNITLVWFLLCNNRDIGDLFSWYRILGKYKMQMLLFLRTTGNNLRWYKSHGQHNMHASLNHIFDAQDVLEQFMKCSGTACRQLRKKKINFWDCNFFFFGFVLDF